MFIVIILVTFVVSLLTLFSGFGLGTLLMPAFVLFFPVDLSIALTAIVHLLNNIFKLVLLGKQADRNVVVQFGVPAVVAAFLGAGLLSLLSQMPPLASYQLGARFFVISPVKFVVSLLIVSLAISELIPAFHTISFDRRLLPVGGVISGFLGGISGHQGALRSAFLIRAGLAKESFIATGVVIACLVDFTRLSVYARHFQMEDIIVNLPLLASAVASAFVGVIFGKRFLPKITFRTVQVVVSVMLISIGVALGLGWI